MLTRAKFNQQSEEMTGVQPSGSGNAAGAGRSPADRALATYMRWKAQIEVQEAFFNATPKEDLTLTMYELREETLKPLFNKLEATLIECEPEAVSEVDHNFLVNRYFELMGIIRDGMKTLTVDRDGRDDQGRADNMKTPKLEIPKFDGSIEKWPRYRDMFTSLVHNNRKLGDMMKYTYLEATFIIPFGQPNVLSNFQMTERNYQDAWKAVCERYNDNRRLIAHHMNAMLETKKMTSYSATELMRVIDCFATNLCALSQLGFSMDGQKTAEMIFVHLMMTKLDDEVIREWRIHNDADVPDWKDLIAYLKSMHRRCQDLESKSGMKPIEPKPSEFKQTKSKSFMSSRSDLSKSYGGCLLCEASHALWTCPKFKAMDSSDRWSIVKRNRLCFVCLTKGQIGRAHV